MSYSLNSSAQNSYFSNDPIWTVHSACAFTTSDCIENKNFNYYVNGDTSFNNHIYKKLFIKGNSWFMWFNNPPIPPYCQGTSQFNDTINPLAFVRDTLNKIYLSNTSFPDTLLYDFNLSVGDTLPMTYNNGNTNITVITIDSIPVSSSYLKRFHLSPNSQSQYLIEGIGHDGGFLEPFPPIFDCGFNLVCYGQNDSSYYPAIGLSCNLNVSLNEIFNQPYNLSIFPNPSLDKINIQSTNPVLSVIIYNSLSQPVLSFVSDNNSLSNFNISTLNPGIYYLEAKTKNSSHSIFKKIIKLESK